MSGMIRAPGTATFTNGSATVTGSGTDWTVSARPGALIRHNSNKIFYEILTVNSDTSITLVENWSGTTGASGFEILPWFSGEDDAPTAISVQIAQFLSAYSELFAVSGNSKTQTFNKGTSGSNAGAVFQIAGVGYFRVGMFGDTVFRLERSTDGTNWTAVWAVDRSTGAITITPNLILSGNVGLGTASPAAKFHSLVADEAVSALFSGASKAVRTRHTSTRGFVEGISHDQASWQPLSLGGSALYFQTGGADRALLNADGHLIPATDTLYALGAAAYRWLNVYSAGIDVSHNYPRMRMKSLTAPTNRKTYDFLGYENGVFALRSLNDAEDAEHSVFYCTRGTNHVVDAMAVGQQLLPATDSNINLGGSGNRWSVIYAATGTINTSDQKEKTPLRGLSEAERRVARKIFGMIGVFQWLSAVAEKGEDGARLHIGVTAQALRQAFADEGLDPARYGVWCRDPIMVKVKKTRTVTRPKMETRTVETTEIVVEDGVPVQKIITREEKRQAVVMVPVLDANGLPVMQPPSQKIGPDGNPMFTEPVFKLDAAGKVMLTDPVFALDEKGKPLLTRDGKQIMISPPQPIVEKAPEPVMNEPRPLLHPVPQVEEVEEEYEEQEESGEFREGIRPDQLYAFVTAGAAEFVQEQQMQIASLEQRVAALEGA